MNETLSVIDLQFSGTSQWAGYNAAQKAGFNSCVGDSWSSDKVLTAADVPADAKVLWEDSRPGQQDHDVVIQTSDSVVSICRNRRDFRCTVYAAEANSAADIMQRLRELIPVATRQSKLLDVTFWYSTVHGPRSYDRQLQAPAWAEIEANYPTNTRERLTDLQHVELNDSSGKLILWQGEPGTGKTFALRALGEEWADWCRIHYVLDPEKFFTEGDYLLNVILGGDSLPSAGEKQPWRLIVLEDAGEMLAKDAKLQVGQGLARLLNLCDGLLGQGLRVLVLITTNEQIGTLHSAVSRPGRCLSQVEFARFSQAEAGEWLKTHGRENTAVMKQSSLADLYALLDGCDLAPSRAVGFGT